MDEEDREIVTNATYRQVVELGNFVSFRDEILSRRMKYKRNQSDRREKELQRFLLVQLGSET